MGQGVEDALRFSGKLPTGTARSLSMSNAFGALGGDATSIGINPAGIAVYRSSEFTLTPSLIFNRSEASAPLASGENDQITFVPNQVAVVMTFKPIREQTQGIVSTHFGLSYNRMANHNLSSFQKGIVQYPGGASNGISLLDQYVRNANGTNEGNLAPFDARLAYDAYILDPLVFKLDNGETVTFNNTYFHAFQKPTLEIITDPITGQVTYNAIVNDRISDRGLQKGQRIERDGNTNEYSIQYGVNVNHTFFLGASLGIETMRYKEHSVYRETPNGGLAPSGDPAWDAHDLDYFDYQFNLKQNGVGVNFKIGAIYKPVNALRLGFAYHTPTFYSIREEYSSNLISQFLDGDRYISRSPLGEYEYSFRTPGKWVASAALLVGNLGLVSFDYERANYGNGKFKSNSNGYEDFSSQNTELKNALDVTQSLRVGAEIKLMKEVAFRLGYGHYGSPFQSQAILNRKTDTYSTGLGFRSKYYFVDVAYMNIRQSNDYILYNWESIDYGTISRLKISDHQVALTVGYRF